VDAHNVDVFDHLWKSSAKQCWFLGLTDRLIDTFCILISILRDRFSDFAVVNPV
jgi:hypothetical protein